MEEKAKAKAPGAKALGSSHVIDLRQGGGVAAPVKPKAPKPKPKPAARKPAPKPVSKPEPVAVVEPEPVEEVAASEVVPARPRVRQSTPLSDDFIDTAPSRRRFWPAFWRFLVLLVVLGVILTGSVYIYLNYVAK